MAIALGGERTEDPPCRSARLVFRLPRHGALLLRPRVFVRHRRHTPGGLVLGLPRPLWPEGERSSGIDRSEAEPPELNPTQAAEAYYRHGEYLSILPIVINSILGLAGLSVLFEVATRRTWREFAILALFGT